MTLDYKSGSEVKLFGLVGAKHYNERVARIVSYRYVTVWLCKVVVCKSWILCGKEYMRN